jgi:drug/metabolite transporter (DMT)-like permease
VWQYLRYLWQCCHFWTRAGTGRLGVMPAVIAALAVVYLVWGSTYVAMRVGVETLPPLTLSGVRFLVAGLLLYAWAAWRRSRRPGRWAVPTRRQWLAAAVVGLLLPAAGTGGATWAEQKLPAGTAALLLATIPLWMILAAWLVDRERISVPVAAGLALGIGGTAVLVNPFTAGVPDPVAATVALVGAMCWGAGSVYARRAPLPAQPLAGSGMEMICAGTVLLVLGAAAGEFGRIGPHTVSAASAAALVYLTLFGSLLAYTAYEWLLHHAPSPLVSTYAFVNPVVAVALGWLLLDERLTARIAVAAAVIVAGVALIVTRSSTPGGRASAGSSRRRARSAGTR